MTRRWGIRAVAPLAAFLAAAAGLGFAEAEANTGPEYKVPKRPVHTHPAPKPSVRTVVLSNERTLSRWANPRHPGPIFARPVPGARKIGSVHMRTEDGFPEVYLLLREQFDTHRRTWVELRIPGRPNGRTGWVRRNELRALEITRWLLVVNRHTERITAYHDGRRVFKAPVGIGKPSTPTPAGHFWIRERFKVSDPSSPYWPYALGTADYSTLSEWPGGGVVGIHGQWDAPQLIPGDPSHGCIRMLNHDIAWLAPRVPVGTPLHVI
jgi:lipoprotein-anchoring transpeptidase ErfK/SrfK